MNRRSIFCMAFLFLLATSACTDNSYSPEEDDFPELPSDPEMPSFPETSENLLDFTIEFDENDMNYSQMEETVITDPDKKGYDDFMENVDFSQTVHVAYNGTEAAIVNETSGVNISREGCHVTIWSSVPGVEYVLSGETEDGFFKIYSDEPFKLTLSGVSIVNPVGAAVNIQSSQHAFIVSETGTTNSLTDGNSYTETDGEDMKGCLFSEGPIVFSGEGSLSVTGNYNHAIVSDDYIRFRNGCNINVVSAENDGIHTNDAVIINGGILNVSSLGDAIQCSDGRIEMTGGFAKVVTQGEKAHGLKAGQDILFSGGALQTEVTGAASKGISCDGNLSISAGKMTLLTSGDALYEEDEADLSSCAGIKCDHDIMISGGEVSLLSTGLAGKGINCDGMLRIDNGTVRIITTGMRHVYGQLDSSAKGIKADGELIISDGTVLVRATGGEGSEGIESKSVLTINGGTVAVLCYDDCMNASDAINIGGGNIYCYSSNNDAIDSNGTLSVSGGLVIAAGAGSVEGGFDCDRNTFAITGGTLVGIGGSTSTPTISASTQHSLVYGGSGNNGDYLNIRTSGGKNVLTYQIPRNYSRMRLLFSAPGLTTDENYILSIGGTVSGGTSFYGFLSGNTCSGGTDLENFTVNSMVMTLGNTSGWW